MPERDPGVHPDLLPRDALRDIVNTGGHRVMAIGGSDRINAFKLRQAIQELQQLLPQNSGACDTQGSGGCSSDAQTDFQDLVDEIRQLADRLESLEPQLTAQGDSGEGRLNLHFTA